MEELVCGTNNDATRPPAASRPPCPLPPTHPVPSAGSLEGIPAHKPSCSCCSHKAATLAEPQCRRESGRHGRRSSGGPEGLGSRAKGWGLRRSILPLPPCQVTSGKGLPGSAADAEAHPKESQAGRLASEGEKGGRFCGEATLHLAQRLPGKDTCGPRLSAQAQPGAGKAHQPPLGCLQG